VLGIMIGITAVILTVGLGEGAQQQVSSQISALGSNLLTVTPGSTTSSSGIRGGFGSASTLTVGDAAALTSKVVAPDIGAVAPATTSNESLVAGTSNWTTTVVGTDPSWLTVRGRTLTEGRFIVNNDVATKANVVVLGATTAQELFGFRDPVGQSVNISGQPMSVIGVLNTVGSSSTSSTASNPDDQAILPLTTASSLLFSGASRNSVSQILIQATSANTLSAAYQEADAELLSLHGITTATAADFTITSEAQILSTATSVDKTLTVLLGGVAGISLLVGGIGVMNIMLVSVTERIREIGLRKALGATPRVIRRQFLVEASVLGTVGGILGALLGLIGAVVLPHFISDPITISPVAAIGAIAIAIGIGIAFGVYPAGRAARLAPIDALRSE
jgi:putative ABC transport system permease protein